MDIRLRQHHKSQVSLSGESYALDVEDTTAFFDSILVRGQQESHWQFQDKLSHIRKGRRNNEFTLSYMVAIYVRTFTRRVDPTRSREE